MVMRNRVILLATATALLASPSIAAAGKAVVATSSTSPRIMRSNVDLVSRREGDSHGHLRHKKRSANDRPRHDRQSQSQSQSQSRQRNLFFFTWITTSPAEPEDAAVDTAGVDPSTSTTPAPSTSTSGSTTTSTTSTTAAEDASITLGTVPLHHDGHIHNDVNLEGGTASATIISQETGEVISVTLNDNNHQNSDNNNNDIEATMIATFPTMPMEETSTTAASTATKTTEGPTTSATATMTTQDDSGESFDWIDVNVNGNGNGDESFNIVLDEEILDAPPPSSSSSSSCHSDADCPASKPTCLDLSNGACFFPPCGSCVEEPQLAGEVGEEEVQQEAVIVEQEEPEEAVASTISVLDEVSQRLPPTTTTTTTTTTSMELNGDIEMDTDADILPTDMETGPGTLATSSGSTVGSTTETMAPVTRTTSPPPKTESSSRESQPNTVVPDIPMDSTTSTGFATSTATAAIASTVTDGTDAAKMDWNPESTSSSPTEGIVTIPVTTSVTSVIPQVDIDIDGLDSIAEDVDPDTHSQSDTPTISLDAKEQESKETSEATRPATVFATFRNVEEGDEGMSPEGELELEGSIPTETTPAAIITTTEAAATTTATTIVSWPSGERLGDYTSCGFTCCTNDDCAAGGGCCVEGKCVVDIIASAEAMNGMGSEDRCGAVIGPPADVVCGYDAWLAFEMDGNCV